MPHALTMNDRLPFGKYQGKLVSTVIREDPDYLDWWDNEVGGWPLDEDALDELERELDYRD